jgi:hypothetical protein
MARITTTGLLLAVILNLAAAPATGLRFEVTVAPGLLEKPTDGRLLVVLGKPGEESEPRQSIGEADASAPPYLGGADVNGFAPGVVGVIDASSESFPVPSLAKVPAGDYIAQAVFAWNRELNVHKAPNNLFSSPRRIHVDPAANGAVQLALTRREPADNPPPDTDTVKYVKLHSKLLSDFHHRPMYLRAAVLLPRDYPRQPDQRYPLLVVIGGYGVRYTEAARWRDRRGRAADVPMVMLHLDGAGPFGDPYQVNSDNNGPYGDAVTRELIPFVESKYRCVGTPRARFTTGTSTGGWVSLALQVFYPEYFNGCWSFSPDPVDFRAYELINLYEDENAYVNRFGFERPAKRNVWSDCVYTVRHECQVENVLGRGNRWWISGKDWCAWNAVFGPHGADGLPKPLWHPKTGAIDRSVIDHWKKYDLRLVLHDKGGELGAKLRGKLHIFSGDADDYFLNNAVHLLESDLRRTARLFEGHVQFGPMAGHGYHPVNEFAEIMARYEAAKQK